jgi:hypothetical protein
VGFLQVWYFRTIVVVKKCALLLIFAARCSIESGPKIFQRERRNENVDGTVLLSSVYLDIYVLWACV